MKYLFYICLLLCVANGAMGQDPCTPRYQDANETSAGTVFRGVPPDTQPLVAPPNSTSRPPDLTAPQKDAVKALERKGYTDFEVIGGGGMGSVVRAKKDGKYFAFKIAKEGDVNAKAMEAEFFYLEKIAKAHAAEVEVAKREGREPPPNPFPKDVQLIKEPGIPPIVRMEFIAWDPAAQGRGAERAAVPLATLISEGKLTFEQKVKIADGVRQALAQLHSYGIVSRDLKPGNIVVDQNGVVRIIDFGLSAEVGKRPRAVTDPDAISGTQGYMAPEQLRGELPIPSHDLYSLGQTLMDLFVPPDQINKYKIPRVPLWFNSQWGMYYDYGAPPEGALPNHKNLAIALMDYRHRTPEQYDEGIVNALTMDDANFLRWYGQQLKVGESAPASLLAAEKILASPTLLEAYPKGLGLSKDQADAVEKAVAKIKDQSMDYRRRANGDVKAVNVPADNPNPWGHFKRFDARVKKVKETPTLQP